MKTVRLHDVLCTYVFAEFVSVFPPSLIYTRVLTMDELETLVPILLTVMAGAIILLCIPWPHSFLEKEALDTET